jgi:hypothetical protein
MPFVDAGSVRQVLEGRFVQKPSLISDAIAFASRLEASSKLFPTALP